MVNQTKRTSIYMGAQFLFLGQVYYLKDSVKNYFQSSSRSSDLNCKSLYVRGVRTRGGGTLTQASYVNTILRHVSKSNERNL